MTRTVTTAMPKPESAKELEARLLMMMMMMMMRRRRRRRRRKVYSGANAVNDMRRRVTVQRSTSKQPNLSPYRLGRSTIKQLLQYQ